MTEAEQQAELLRGFEETAARWCPEFSLKTESRSVQTMRTLLAFRAYDLDAQRCLRGERPIRTDYPLPLPQRLTGEQKDHVASRVSSAITDAYNRVGTLGTEEDLKLAIRYVLDSL